MRYNFDAAIKKGLKNYIIYTKNIDHIYMIPLCRLDIFYYFALTLEIFRIHECFVSSLIEIGAEEFLKVDKYFIHFALTLSPLNSTIFFQVSSDKQKSMELLKLQIVCVIQKLPNFDKTSFDNFFDNPPLHG